MIEMSLTQARDALADTVSRVTYGGERIVLQKHGKSVAAVVSVEDAELLERLEDREDLKAAMSALLEAKQKGTKSWAAVKKGLGL
jgi:prevent-host-death family protein